MLITFSGLDGAGKSTLIDRLRATLEAEQRAVSVFHMNDHVGVYAYLRAVRNRLVPRRSLAAPSSSGSAARPVGHAVRSGHRGTDSEFLQRMRYVLIWNKSLRSVIYPFDLLLFLCYRVYVERICRRILIMDRYFYDTLVDVSDGKKWYWIRWLNSITPTPTIAVFLDISPEESYTRKGEYSVEYLRRRWKAYAAVRPLVATSLHLPTSDLDQASDALQRVVLNAVRAS